LPDPLDTLGVFSSLGRHTQLLLIRKADR
jgi:hypothetical protein